MAEAIQITPTTIITNAKKRNEFESILAEISKYKVQKKDAEFHLDDNKSNGTPGLVTRAITFLKSFPTPKTEFGGWVHRMQAGSNVSYSKDLMVRALNRRGFTVQEIEEFIEEVKVVSPYTTIVTTAKKEEEVGGATGTRRRAK